MADPKTLFRKLADSFKRDSATCEKALAEFVRTVPAQPGADGGKMWEHEDKKILDAAFEVLATEVPIKRSHPDKAILLLETIRRLLLFKNIYKQIKPQHMSFLLDALRTTDPETATLAAIRCVANLLMFSGPGKDNQIHSAEMANKSEFNSASGFTVMTAIIGRQESVTEPSMDIICSVMRTLSSVINHGCRSSDVIVVQSCTSSLESFVPSLLNYAHSDSHELSYSASVLLEGMLFHANVEVSRRIQDTVVNDGSILYYFLRAITAHSVLVPNEKADADWILPGRSKAEVAVDFFGYLAENHSEAMKMVFRCLPRSFQDYLIVPVLQFADPLDGRDLGTSLGSGHVRKVSDADSKLSPFALSSSGSVRVDARSTSLNNVIYVKYLAKKNNRSNWPLLFMEIDRDHFQPHLIWNDTTRVKLIQTVVEEIEAIALHKRTKKDFVWDCESFDVHYDSFVGELEVDGYFLRLLIPALESSEIDYEVNSKDIIPLMGHLYNRAVIEDNPTWKYCCLKTMTLLYSRYKEVLHVKSFDSLPFLIWLLDPKHTRDLWRDQILDFLLLLLTNCANAKDFLRRGGLEHLFYYLNQVHRPYPGDVNSNVVERTGSFDDYPQVFSPTEVADRVIDILTVLFHRIPRLRRQVAANNHFRYMLQFLIFDLDDIFITKKMILLIRDIISDVPSLIPHLVSFGLFEFMMYAIPSSPQPAYIEVIAEISKYHHYSDDSDSKGDKKSHLSVFLPEPMIRLLVTSGPETFLDVFNSERDEPHLIWNPNLRSLLDEQIDSVIRKLKEALSQDEFTVYQREINDSNFRIEYPPIDGELCIGTMYLRLYNERKGTYNCNFPEYFVSSLAEAMNLDLDDQNLGYLLDAQRTAIQRHSTLQPFQSYRYFPQLLKSLTRAPKTASDVYIIQLASDCVMGLLTIKTMSKGDTSLSNPDICAFDGGAQAITKALLQLIVKINYDIKSISRTEANLLMDELSILDILLCQVGETVANVVNESVDLLAAFVQIFEYSSASKAPHIAIQTLLCVKTMTRFPLLRDRLLSNGSILHLVYISMFGQYDKSLVDSGESRLVISAAEALAGLCGFLADSPSGLPVNKGIRKVLRALITPGLYQELKDIEGYLELCRSDSENPVLIWNDALQKELKEYLEKEIKESLPSGEWSKWEKDPFEFSFVGLKDQIVVDDVYVYVYNNNNNWLEFKLPNGPSIFMERLLFALRTQVQSINDANVPDADVQETFHYVTAVSLALKNLISVSMDVLQSSNQQLALEVITEMFENKSLRPAVLQCGLLILEQLSLIDASTILFVTPYSHILHRILNFDRHGDLTALPSISLTLEVTCQLALRNPAACLPEYHESGFVISLMYLISHSMYFLPEHRLLAARLLGIMCNDLHKGEVFRFVVEKLTSKTFIDGILDAKTEPKKFLKLFDSDWDTPQRFWTASCRKDLLRFLEVELIPIKVHQLQALHEGVSSPFFQWDWSTLQSRVDDFMLTMNSQMCVDGIYVHAFNANPYFQVKPDRFLSMIIQALHNESESYLQTKLSEDEYGVGLCVSNLTALWEAVRNLLTNLPHLQDGCVSELDFLFAFFDPAVHFVLQEECLRVASILSTNSACAENIAKLGLLCKVMPLLVTMAGRGKTSSILSIMMEVTRRSSPAVKQIRSLGGIVMLINVLLQSSFSKSEKKSAAQVLNAMIQDNIYGKMISEYVCRILTKQFKETFQARPERFLAMIANSHESMEDGRVWDDDVRDALREMFGEEVQALALTMPSWDGKSELFDVETLSAIWKDS